MIGPLLSRFVVSVVEFFDRPSAERIAFAELRTENYLYRLEIARLRAEASRLRAELETTRALVDATPPRIYRGSREDLRSRICELDGVLDAAIVEGVEDLVIEFYVIVDETTPKLGEFLDVVQDRADSIISQGCRADVSVRRRASI